MDGLGVYDVNLGPNIQHPLITSRFLAIHAEHAHRMARTWLEVCQIRSWEVLSVTLSSHSAARIEQCRILGHAGAMHCVNCGSMFHQSVAPSQPETSACRVDNFDKPKLAIA